MMMRESFWIAQATRKNKFIIPVISRMLFSSVVKDMLPYYENAAGKLMQKWKGGAGIQLPEHKIKHQLGQLGT